jgi:ribosomal protein S25
MSTQTTGRKEKYVGGVDIPPLDAKDTLGALKGMKAITPNGVAIKFNIKISVAKRMLTTLEEKGVVEFVTRSKNLKVYKMVDES